MRKINILYVDDEVLFIRIVKRIIEHDNEWKDRISFWSACHQFHALSILKENPKVKFDLVIVDYRLEADKKEDEELNGVRLAQHLKKLDQCKNSIFALLSATGEIVDKELFEFNIKKGSGKLESEFEKMLEIAYNKTMYGYDIYDKMQHYGSKNTYKYLGDTEKHKFIRFIIDKKLSQKESLLIYGSEEENNNLVNDIIFSTRTKTNVVDLSLCNNIQSTLENTLEKRSRDVNIFLNLDSLDNERLQKQILSTIKNQKSHFVFTFTDKKKCNYFLENSDEILLPKSKNGESKTSINIAILNI